jgi:protein-tyrosine phosphatase
LWYNFLEFKKERTDSGMMQYRRLPLEGLCNARELGGFAARGGITRYGAFVRCEIPAQLTEGDIRFLKDYGVTTVLDFRSDRETESVPDVLRYEGWLRYVPMPMFNEQAALGAGKDETRPPLELMSWDKVYIDMVDSHKEWTRDVINELAAAPGCAMYHCTTGKDRTGIATALLLGLCGVSDNDIIADYCTSEVFLRPMYENMGHLLPTGKTDDFSNPFFSTAPENMRALLRHLENTYGGIEKYVISCGVSEETIEKIRKKLIKLA